ncbi:MAG: conjugal transfer protein [Actinobacteria bacterium]|nr:conjugal transfer protein [Actinomycetota bacterium]
MRQLVSSLTRLPKLSPRSHRADAHPSLRMIRLRARGPRILLALLVLVLCVAGLRSIFGGRAASARPVAAGPRYDVGAAAFAQSFTAAYLTWGPQEPEGARIGALKPFLAQGLEADAGLAPAPRTADSVAGTEVAEERRVGTVTDVLVVAETSAGTQYLSVPVARGERGLLAVVSYPALVGPPATDTAEAALTLSAIEDKGLETVVSRGLRNYLTGQATNLRADLTAEAVVSLPTQPLEVSAIDSFDWLVPKRTVAVRVEAKDAQGARLTLTYQVGVVRRVRWYIDSIQVDPTLKGGM